MTDGQWRCVGDGPPHPAFLEHAESLPNRGRDSVAVERCRHCGALYRHHDFEVTDWGENGDYYSATHIWTPVTPAEIDRLRADPAFEPAAGPAHRWDSGWRAG